MNPLERPPYLAREILEPPKVVTRDLVTFRGQERSGNRLGAAVLTTISNAVVETATLVWLARLT